MFNLTLTQISSKIRRDRPDVLFLFFVALVVFFWPDNSFAYSHVNEKKGAICPEEIAEIHDLSTYISVGDLAIRHQNFLFIDDVPLFFISEDVSQQESPEGAIGRNRFVFLQNWARYRPTIATAEVSLRDIVEMRNSGHSPYYFLNFGWPLAIIGQIESYWNRHGFNHSRRAIYSIRTSLDFEGVDECQIGKCKVVGDQDRSLNVKGAVGNIRLASDLAPLRQGENRIDDTDEQQSFLNLQRRNPRLILSACLLGGSFLVICYGLKREECSFLQVLSILSVGIVGIYVASCIMIFGTWI